MHSSRLLLLFLLFLHLLLLLLFLQGYVFEYSVLFYGYYDSGQNEPYLPPPHNPNPHIMLNYKLPLAYLLVSVAVFVVCIMAILFK